MTRGNVQQTKVIYQGTSDDFIVFVDSIRSLEKWKKDSSIPLAQVVNAWQIFCSHKQGAQGILDTVSNSNLESEFGTSDNEEVIKKILTSGSPQTSTGPERQGDTNITAGPTVPH